MVWQLVNGEEMMICQLHEMVKHGAASSIMRTGRVYAIKRTKEALTAKKLDGMALGKPKGTIQKSKFDLQRDKIEELLSVGLSVRKISKLLGYNNHIGLNNYVKKRKIKTNLKAKEL